MKSLTKSKKHLSFDVLRKAMSSHIESINDTRQQGKCAYTVHDTVMSAFACMYFQDPSLAQFQKRLEKRYQRSNLNTLFHVKATPKDNQMKDILDALDSEYLAPIFKDYYERLRRHHHLKDYEVLPGKLLCAIDGTQYHSSKSVHCDCCLTKQHRNGDITYSHAVLQGAIMHSSKRQVIPVMPEAIKNTDGAKKQDCEMNAAKRFVKRLKKAHPRQQFIICGDGLMSKQPLIEATLAEGFNVLFMAKKDDHKYMYEWLAEYPSLPSKSYTDEEITHEFTWQNDVPLHGGEKSIRVNYLSYRQVKGEKQTYIGSWVTDIEINEDNVIDLAKAGRSRWKIENECFNSLKNQGYEVEHNYGHGSKNLSYNMYLLTLLAFFYHQIFELTDGVYQQCRKEYGSKRFLWENFRITIRFVLFKSWADLMQHLLSDHEITEDAYYRP